jgi:hypothetical protein
MSKMEEEAGKYTQEQLVEIMLDFSGMDYVGSITKPDREDADGGMEGDSARGDSSDTVR